ncbi:MAG: MoaD/ThiS family protein [Gammaproteobacteria bacterium]|jgi:hypothetical protein|nr:MoaD/ThiS family protein [Gammaproteobacteria bacterium]
MARITFTGNVQPHVPCPTETIPGDSVADALGTYFEHHPLARGYVLDDQGAVRRHMVILVDGIPIRDRARLSDALARDSEVFVFQALSGG